MATQAGRERIAGYRRALRKLGRLRQAIEIMADGNGFGDGVAATERLLARPEAGEVDAIFYASDALATGGLHALARAGRNVPGEIAVAGFGDIISSAVTVPSLTTVRVPMREIGTRSMQLLLGALTEPGAASESILLPTTVVERDSA
jgi:DNA-binding LacI/PurR family transcriptional regulator